MQLCSCCTPCMHASFAVNTLFMIFLLQMETVRASLNAGVAAVLISFSVIYMNPFKLIPLIKAIMSKQPTV